MSDPQRDSSPTRPAGPGTDVVAVCPGSFDPPTLGHLDIIERTARLFAEVRVAVLRNPDKHSLFSVDERMELLRQALAQLPNVVVDSFDGLLVDYCRDRGVSVIVKGLRAASDFDYELRMAQMNTGLTGVTTMFLPTAPQYAFVSSSLIKVVARGGGDVSPYLPEQVLTALRGKLAR